MVNKPAKGVVFAERMDYPATEKNGPLKAFSSNPWTSR
jgi:hypothetical protein